MKKIITICSLIALIVVAAPQNTLTKELLPDDFNSPIAYICELCSGDVVWGKAVFSSISSLDSWDYYYVTANEGDVLTVAILGTAAFDVLNLDPDTLVMGINGIMNGIDPKDDGIYVIFDTWVPGIDPKDDGVYDGIQPKDDGVRLKGVEPFKRAYEDVARPFDGEHEAGPDGLFDLVLDYHTQEIVDAFGDVAIDIELVAMLLEGYLTDGTPIIGEVCMVILKKDHD